MRMKVIVALPDYLRASVEILPVMNTSLYRALRACALRANEVVPSLAYPLAIVGISPT